MVRCWQLLAPGRHLQSIGWDSGERRVFPPYSNIGLPSRDFLPHRGAVAASWIASCGEVSDKSQLTVENRLAGSLDRSPMQPRALRGRRVRQGDLDVAA